MALDPLALGRPERALEVVGDEFDEVLAGQPISQLHIASFGMDDHGHAHLATPRLTRPHPWHVRYAASASAFRT
jgi:hypothetical protein